MAILSDHIEEFIKSMLAEYDEMVELQRNELASYFSCAPSQINYVLATRFSPEKGYLIESRRGGGGYIKVIKINPSRQEHISALISDKLSGGKIGEGDAYSLIEALHGAGYLSNREERLMKQILSDKALNIPALIKDNVRANILKEALFALLMED